MSFFSFFLSLPLRPPPLFVPFLAALPLVPGFFHTNNNTLRFNLLFVCFIFFLLAYMSCVYPPRCGLCVSLHVVQRCRVSLRPLWLHRMPVSPPPGQLALWSPVLPRLPTLLKAAEQHTAVPVRSFWNYSV